MRTFASIQALVSKDLDQRQKLVEQIISFDDDDADTSAEYNSTLITLPALASDIAVNFGGVTAASFVIILAYADVTVKLDGTGAPALPVTTTPAKVGGNVLSNLQRFTQPGVMLWRGSVSSIHLANPSATDTADVFVAVVGNAP